MNIDGKIWVSADYPHIRIPKRMLHDQHYRLLSPEAMLLYGAMMDRTSLSHKNQSKFKNKKGETYIYFSQNEIMQLLGCGHDKATKVLRELVEAGLVKVNRRGIGRPYEIVLKPVDWRPMRKIENEQPEKSLRCSEKTDYSLCGKAEGNNTEYNNYENIDSEYYLRKFFKYQIAYDELVDEYDREMTDRVVDIALSALNWKAESLMVGGVQLDTESVKKKLLHLKKDHFWYVLGELKNESCAEEHTDAFILNALYDATLNK